MLDLIIPLDVLQNYLPNQYPTIPKLIYSGTMRLLILNSFLLYLPKKVITHQKRKCFDISADFPDDA
jgi:hypothetical protein